MSPRPVLSHSFACCLAALVSAVAVAQPPAIPLVVVAPVVQREVAPMQMFVGTIMPAKAATIGSAVDGRVVEFPIEEGDRVEAGQKLAQLLTDTASLELAAAQAELDLRRHRLEELENGSRPEEIEQARARMDAARLRFELAGRQRDRAEALAQRNDAISEEAYDAALSRAAEAEQSYLETVAAHKLVVAGPRREQIAQAQAEVAVQQARVEILEDRIKKHAISSRFAGYIVAERTELGAWLSRGDPVAEVIALDHVEVVARVVENSVPYIRSGTQVRIEIPAFGDQLFEGEVLPSAPRADVVARTFPIRVRVENEITGEGPLLRAGMIARVALPVGQPQQSLLAPKDAIVLGGESPVVFLTNGADAPNGEATVRAAVVTLGVASGSLIQVTGNLTADDYIVIEGNERLRPQQKVRIQRVANAGGDAG